ncbi:MAG: orange carotenoid protein [Leptolyngbyaceae cyanobacterium SM1_1_3]|nr:orange carotenoid protein [Leptolyngbyaceae cyanobacterium SM1_1_3]NJN04271.1 orange carotenoid protein [Leptolyngbyaceae cyanobacterium RM1_1_2]NJO11614.1 orange carotenoid protein [Leptolyngbyaceae cyanobacterium SL_1_1]
MVSAKDAQSSILSDDAKQVYQAYSQLGTDEKLALLYYVYEKMGDTVTPAAPDAAEPELVNRLATGYFDLDDEAQLAIMREIVEGKDSESSRAYGGLTANNQLLVWYIWADAMGDRVVDMPGDYEASDAVSQALKQIENLEFESQISVLREAASAMGYSEVKPIATQAETGKTPSL